MQFPTKRHDRVTQFPTTVDGPPDLEVSGTSRAVKDAFGAASR
jgi:hypothetical protein